MTDAASRGQDRDTVEATQADSGTAPFLLSEFVLAGASEGYNKWTWIEAGTVPNALLALGFCFLQGVPKESKRMTVPPGRPTLTPAAIEALNRREAAQASALRENLRRRKQQARSRQGTAASEEPEGVDREQGRPGALPPPSSGDPAKGKPLEPDLLE